MNDVKSQKKLFICTNKTVAIGRPSCGLRGSEKTMALLKEELALRNLDIGVENITCLGQCNYGPTLRISGGGNFYLGADPDRVTDIVDWLEEELKS